MKVSIVKKAERCGSAYETGINPLFFIQNAHRRVENSRIVQRNHPAVGPLFEVNSGTLLRIEMFSSEIIAYRFDIDTQFVCNTLRASARQSVLDSAQFIKCNNHNRMV